MADGVAPHSLFDLTGKVACVTGASSGLGRRAAITLARAGACVVGLARRAAQLDDLQAELPDRIQTRACNVAELDALPSLAEQVSAMFGAPDIIVHAAGMNPRKPADETGVEDWNNTITLNLSVPFLLSQAFVPAMRAKGWGRIINFASLQSSRAFPNGIAYGAS